MSQTVGKKGFHFRICRRFQRSAMGFNSLDKKDLKFNATLSHAKVLALLAFYGFNP